MCYRGRDVSYASMAFLSQILELFWEQHLTVWYFYYLCW
jgi:hypothetical protein